MVTGESAPVQKVAAVLDAGSRSKMPVPLSGHGAAEEDQHKGLERPTSSGAIRGPPSEQLWGGTINQTGLFYMRVTHTVSENALSCISSLVQQAQSRKPRVQYTADRVASVFVPCVVALSLVTFFVWFALAESGSVGTSGLSSVAFALRFALAVVVVSCPCAIGLAAPTAIMVATGMAARLGVLFSDGTVLERMTDIDTVVFDKTGTLTLGRPQVTDYHLFAPRPPVLSQAERVHERVPDSESESAHQFWTVVAAVESGSEHNLAMALRGFAQQRLAEHDGEIFFFFFAFVCVVRWWDFVFFFSSGVSFSLLFFVCSFV